jgi:hypothetical protein
MGIRIRLREGQMMRLWQRLRGSKTKAKFKKLKNWNLFWTIISLSLKFYENRPKKVALGLNGLIHFFSGLISNNGGR